MTLPIQPLCAAENNNSSAALPLRGAAARRKQQCVSAAFADAPSSKRERRRAICSWSVGYGTLSHQPPPLHHHHLHHHQLQQPEVADHNGTGSQLLLGRRPQPLPALLHADVAAAPVHRASPLQQQAQPAKSHHQLLPPPPPIATQRRNFLTMPGLKSLVSRRRNSGSAEPSSVPLVQSQRRNGSSSSNLVRSAASLASLRKCETVLALTGVLRTSSSSSDIDHQHHQHPQPIRAVNRLRDSVHGSASHICSRCSSLLSLASTSRYSLDATTGGFVQVPKDTPDGSDADCVAEDEDAVAVDTEATRTILCKLCLAEVPSRNAIRLQQCNCAFCSECMKAYVQFEIAEGAYDISCPDAQCPAQGVLVQEEIKRLVGDEMLEKHLKYRLNREVEIDKNRMWCPRAGCETVCNVCPPTKKRRPQCVHCPRCAVDFCSACKLEWHPDLTCEEHNKQLAKQGRVEETGIPFDSDLIKCCPMCNVPIEKDEGCAQMMCKRCKHVFCWYCLASLDDDFLLRHYDKGPCKNKLGHSRASVIWHRTQVIGIFAGFGILLLVASPLLLLAAPCIVCCKCRVCNAGTTKLDNEEELPGESNFQASD